MTRDTEIYRLRNKDLPAWVNYLAQDADGTWWGYETEPHPHHQGWYENEVGRCVRIHQTPPNPDWILTLTHAKRDAAATSTG